MNEQIQKCHTHTNGLSAIKKEQNRAVGNNMNEPRGLYAK